ncbi:plasmid stabilization system protein [mine drainage metagenome]|jgi:plasmid stabilization system protein ParE|uniref:Plasmid stabilization system protein n=1 Tax=mine drainage metagenome TaxID=410659 RepID=A0A1J5QA79_9ZZZZ
MTRIELAPEVLQDFDRFLDHLAQFDEDVPGRIAEILEAIQILRHSPEIGRRVKAGKRELVIGHASHGYVALYRFVREIDVVFVLAIRAQRESGYKPRT